MSASRTRMLTAAAVAGLLVTSACSSKSSAPTQAAASTSAGAGGAAATTGTTSAGTSAGTTSAGTTTAPAGGPSFVENTNATGTPVKGGTLNMLGVGDVDYMDPNVSYYSGGYLGLRLWSRQLFTFPAKEGATSKPALDLATDFPTTDNGGVSSDGKTVTIKMRDDVNWNTSPARPVTAQDFVRGVKRTCNPIQPFGGTTDFDFLIEGYKKFCADFVAPYAADGAKPAT